MKRIFFLPIAFGILSGIFFLTAYQSVPISESEQSRAFPAEDSTNVLADALALQTLMPAPKTDFRKGHVTEKAISDYLQTRDTGFEIQLPRIGMTPSPTIYKGTVYVSGGFGSKEFYAFDAQTGAIKWAIGLDDDGPSSAVVVDDIVVFNTESCTLFAVKAETGEMLWSYWLGDPLMSTPTIADGKVFTAYPARGIQSGYNSSSNNFIQQQIQQIPVPAQAPQANSTQDSPAEKLRLQGTHVLIAFDLKSGEILWQKWIDGDIMSAPVAETEALYVTTFPGTIYTFNPATGDILSAHATRATSAPVIVGGEIFMSQRADSSGQPVQESISKVNKQFAGQSRGYSKQAQYLDHDIQSQSAYKQEALDYDAGNGFGSGAPANSGWDKASANIGQSNVSSLQAYQGSRILNQAGRNYATMGDEMVCTDAQSGAVLWKKPLKGDLELAGGFLATPPISLADMILIATLEGDLILSNAESGKEIKRYTTGEQIRYQPVVDQGRIYVSTMKGKIICIDTGDPRLTGWPTWGGNPAHTNR